MFAPSPDGMWAPEAMLTVDLAVSDKWQIRRTLDPEMGVQVLPPQYSAPSLGKFFEL